MMPAADPVTDATKLVKLSLMCGCHPGQVRLTGMLCLAVARDRQVKFIRHELTALADKLQRVLRVSISSAQDLPLLFPAVMSFRLCMAAMAAPAFPLSVLGGVLSGYHAIQLRSVPAAEPLAFR